MHADTFPEAVYAAFRQHTMKRPSTRLHYVQHRSIFKFVTRSEAMDMIQTSLTTSDTMAIKQFVMGMSWTKFATASPYDNHLARGGVPETDPRTSKGGYGRHRARSPTPGRTRFPSPRRNRSPSATPTLSRPLQTAVSSSSASTSAPSFGQPADQQPRAEPDQTPPVKAMLKEPPAHLAPPRRAPSPHNKQPAQTNKDGVTDSQVHATGRGRRQHAGAGGAAAPQSSSTTPPDSDDDSRPTTGPAATPRKAPPACLAGAAQTPATALRPPGGPYCGACDACSSSGAVQLPTQSAHRASAWSAAEGSRPLPIASTAVPQFVLQRLG